MEWEPGHGFVVQHVHGLDGLPKANRHAAEQVETGDIILAYNGVDVTGDPDSARETMQQKTVDARVIKLRRVVKKHAKKHHHKKTNHKKSDSEGIGDLLGSLKKQRDKADRKAAEEARKRKEELEFLSRPEFSPVQTRLEKFLQGDTQLNAVHVEVRNESYCIETEGFSAHASICI